jgi:hypothetical protein
MEHGQSWPKREMLIDLKIGEFTMSFPSTRALAAEIKSTKYFTGQPCKHGHYAPRYTQSGTCQDCIAQNQKQHAPVKDDRRQQLQPTNVRVSAENYRRVLDLAYSMTRIRFHRAKPSDIERRKGGRDSQGGLLLYTLYLHPEDAHVVRSYAATLVPALVDVQAARARIFGALQAQADQKVCEPEFRP